VYLVEERAFILWITSLDLPEGEAINLAANESPTGAGRAGTISIDTVPGVAIK
jgi:hypothetical protein